MIVCDVEVHVTSMIAIVDTTGSGLDVFPFVTGRISDNTRENNQKRAPLKFLKLIL
jgi:hypothetical protein